MSIYMTRPARFAECLTMQGPTETWWLRMWPVLSTLFKPHIEIRIKEENFTAFNINRPIRDIGSHRRKDYPYCECFCRDISNTSFVLLSFGSCSNFGCLVLVNMYVCLKTAATFVHRISITYSNIFLTILDLNLSLNLFLKLGIWASQKYIIAMYYCIHITPFNFPRSF